MVSFSRRVKEEVVFNDFDHPSQKALLASFIKINGSLSFGHGDISLTIRSENAKVASKIHRMLKDEFQPIIEYTVKKRMKLKKNNVYYLKVSKAREIFDTLFDSVLTCYPKEEIINSDMSVRAYLAGAFLACGSVNDPETSNYHLELSVNDEEYAEFLKELLNRYELNAKIIQRRNKYITYMKTSEKIGDFLRAIGTSNAVMNFENTRITRNFSNTINRINNCEIANEVKLQKSSSEMIDCINIIDMYKGLDSLDEKTRVVALARRDNPNHSLNELTEVYYARTGQNISKSGIYRRLKKIQDEAKQCLLLLENEE